MTQQRESGAWAASIAHRLLVPNTDRWLHSRAAGRLARVVGVALSEDPEALVCAAYLHDIGYAPVLSSTGLHALDGARFLALLARPRLASLVAHHSGSRFEAELRGHAAELATFPVEASAVADALTYCDMTVGPRGQPMTLPERVADVEERYGDGHVVTRAVRTALPEMSAAVDRTESRLRAAGLLTDVRQ